ncbi:MAG: DUF2169 domain-containing protein [Mesorhizobium sp.]|uniref:DUF2169 family type VI secretion system accessory protein n=1 Tax=Mesorhizobium sp. TaxID=1871066 RepID=UPI000FE74E45|nr:DUF2169 domain-containing protein [Mesorhizobium sp.]RWD60246.1 MAG: DUF2169 domain-containing protein [Mesorhizobium sp.]RWE36165.1 MAG: DUF2169 domain-containing protein [Mesorhizobium sp.]TIV69668.1 MAG: DUF2169 domain-containing protein [Mesorhizobium sp.]
MAFDVWLENRTPFAAATHVQLNADGQETLVVMLSASFAATGEGEEFQPAAQQMPVIFGDEPFGNPSLSSIRYEADIAPVKPGAEVIVNGAAHAPNGKPVREMQVGLRVGSAIRKVLQVVGDRIYDSGAYSAPAPFRTMPIVYERAYGGTLEDLRTDQRNPVGVGFHNARSADPAVRTEAPNVMYPGEAQARPGESLRPAGFGTIGRGWQPRLAFAGTYDKAWLETQWPLAPKDFDTRHYMCGPADQQLAGIGGGEDITVIGMTASGRWDFRLPHITAPLRLIYDDRVEENAFKPDTVLIEPDLKRVTLKARLAVVIRRNVPALREIAFGHISPVWINAHRKRKLYLNLLGGDGTLRDRPAWQP